MMLAKSSAENMETTGMTADAGQYSAMLRMPLGYCQAARRIRAASRSSAETDDRNRSVAT